MKIFELRIIFVISMMFPLVMQTSAQEEQHSARCLQNQSEDWHLPHLNQLPIGLQVTNRSTHQIITHIFYIYLREVLNYDNVYIIPLCTKNVMESYKTFLTLDRIRYHPNYSDMDMINLEVWLPQQRYHVPENIYEAGASMPSGRFGWFVPAKQVLKTDKLQSLQHDVFLDPHNIYYQNYSMDNDTLNELKQFENIEEYNNPLCENIECATLIAEYRTDSGFVENEIEEFQSYVNVIWFGPNFLDAIKKLYDIYERQNSKKRFIVLHWRPSEVISNEYEQILMPRCEDYETLLKSCCKYELTPIWKYYSMGQNLDVRVQHALHKLYFKQEDLDNILDDLRHRRNNLPNTKLENIYRNVACQWLKSNEKTYKEWIIRKKKQTVTIGGIFPLSMESYGHQSISHIIGGAVSVINNSSSILSDYDLEVLEVDGQCKADVVMKAFISYFNTPNILGVLGPGCSETVEPIAGISKHMSMAVISYSAEGTSFEDRETYPYFFRTIGSNRQYEDVYISLMKKLDWVRVAALTEDGQKHTEYITHMEASFRQHNLELIINKKFSTNASYEEMNKHLLDLKKNNAKIIIADIHNRNAVMTLCEAKKLGMTASEGYVWFLPSWLSKDWNVWQALTKSCSSEELEAAFDGHFSIMHTPFGDSNSTMFEGRTVESWLNTYKKDTSGTLSNYGAFAYDAVWVYVLAVDKLLKENQNALENLRTKSVADRLSELIWETDFQGASGRVQFGRGGSRITTLNILQWRKSQFIEIGSFEPEKLGTGADLHTKGGKLNLNFDKIVWATNEKPEDGRFDCGLSSLARGMNTDCYSASIFFAGLVCFSVVICISIVSSMFWKRRYDQKIKKSTKFLKTFGIDLMSSSNNTLDKWEIPKENVVMNRRLGEGAFGTVYGGEAQIGSADWISVAVKTLKAGASKENRLDFLAEAEAMKRFDHKNIVKLLAVCLQSEPIFTIMEFMLYGDLKTYLLARRSMVNKTVSDDSDVSPKRLTMYATDVARGLAYLAEKKYVHRDLACRNCLVNSRRVVKIGDFGMSRPIIDSNYYIFRNKGMVPIRWMAPESLSQGIFTPASDTWAFGVVLYEIITFGSFPYQGLTNNEVAEYVKNGNILQIPAGVKPPLEGLLKACWSQDAKKRPTASELIDYIMNYPRLLMPCLDVPAAAVEMSETDNEEIAWKGCTLKQNVDLDITNQQICEKDFGKINNFVSEVNLMHNSNSDLSNKVCNDVTSGLQSSIFSATTPDGYSVMSPLLIHQTCENSDSSRVQLLNSSRKTLQQTPL